MCDCKENLESFKESIDLTVKNNKNTTISFNINCSSGNKKKIPTPSGINTISLNQAKEWAGNWRNLESNYNKYHKIHAFNIPKLDLIEVLNEENVESIRAYIGVKETTNKKGETEFEEKLMIVGVDEKGKDLLPSSTIGKTLATESDESGIFDFSRPCPTTCDQESPLYK